MVCSAEYTASTGTPWVSERSRSTSTMNWRERELMVELTPVSSGRWRALAINWCTFSSSCW